MAKPKVSPLHKVIDAGRCDAEPPLGRLVMVVHATFRDAGFVLHGATAPKSGWLPKRVGRTASTRTCTKLRRLVTDHDDELWKPRFEALSQSTASGFPLDGDDDDAGAGDSKVSSWKAMYMRANRTGSWLPGFSVYFSWHRLMEPIHYEMATMMKRDLNLSIAGHGRSRTAAWAAAIHSLSSRYRWKHR